MKLRNLLVISSDFPDKYNTYIGNIFVKEQIKYIKNYFENVYVISPLAYGMERLRNTSYENYEFDNVKVYFPKHFNVPLFYFYGRNFWISLEMNSVLELIKRENIHFDLIHAHFTWPSGAVAVELKKYFNAPVVITEHTNNTLYKELNRKNSNYISTWKKSDAIIRVSKKDIPLFISSGVNSNKIYHIVNGYDPTKYFSIAKEKARELLNLPQDIEIILNVSRLYSIKGQDYLIKAMKKITEKRSSCRCYIGGTGPEKDKLKAQIDESGLQDCVHLIGFVPDDKMCLWINACDVFVLPSLNETNPTVMFECLGCGKPFVGTKVGGIPEIITSNDYGLLVEPGNAQDLADKIEIALNRNWDEEIILNYAEQYRWDDIASQIVNVYSEICSKNCREIL